MSLGKAYLLAYNVSQTLGWSVILFKTARALAGGKSNQAIYNDVSWELAVFQTAAVLEVLHCIVGLVRSPVMTTLMQVTSRIVVTWPVVYSVSTAQQTVGVPCILLAWSITEVIRYSFYGLGLINAVPYVLTWLRYTLFIGLYPLGVTGELLCIWSALPKIKQDKIFYYEMPNRLNVSFDTWLVMIGFALLYIPVFPQLYFYMIGQRRKIIGGQTVEKKTQ